MLYHVVLFTVQEEMAGELGPLLADLAQLEERVDVVRSVLVGPAVGGTGYDAGLVVELEDEEALETYRAHPAHAPVLAELRRIGERIDVADFATVSQGGT